MTKTKRVRIGIAEDLSVGASKKFEFFRDGAPAEGFILRHEEGFSAYVNSCAHVGVPLDYGDNDFFREEGDLLRCKTHGALYNPVTGECVGGPCLGAFLEKLRVVREGEEIFVEIVYGIPS
jgi:nitrite reductase/ring-hydroxylating ferredoxin subunit